MDQNYEQIICEAIETVANAVLSQVKFDNTIQAEIYSCENAEQGYYMVKYQDSVFDAYVENTNLLYPIGTRVYVHIPKSNYDNRKLITGSVNPQGNINTTRILEDFEVIEKNLLSKTDNFEVTDENPSDISNNFNTNGVDLSEAKYLYIGTCFKALFGTTPAKGNYGLKLVANFVSNGEEYSKTYTLDTSCFDDGYSLLNPTKKTQVFPFDGANFTGFESVELFSEQFDTTYAITASEAAICAVRYLNTSGYYVKLNWDGDLTLHKSSDVVTIKASLKYNGIDVLDNKQATCYWYRQDDRVVNTYDSTGVNNYQGWSLYDINEGTQEFAPMGQTQAGPNYYRVAIAYGGQTYLRDFCITDESGVNNSQMSFTAKVGEDVCDTIVWNEDLSELVATVTGNLTPVKYYWTARDMYGMVLPLYEDGFGKPEGNKVVRIYAQAISSYVTYSCTAEASNGKITCGQIRVTRAYSDSFGRTLNAEVLNADMTNLKLSEKAGLIEKFELKNLQFGSGVMDKPNVFSGMFAGVVERQNSGQTTLEYGLMGFKEGERTFWLDSDTGNAFFWGDIKAKTLATGLKTGHIDGQNGIFLDENGKMSFGGNNKTFIDANGHFTFGGTNGVCYNGSQVSFGGNDGIVYNIGTGKVGFGSNVTLEWLENNIDLTGYAKENLVETDLLTWSKESRAIITAEADYYQISSSSGSYGISYSVKISPSKTYTISFEIKNQCGLNYSFSASAQTLVNPGTMYSGTGFKTVTVTSQANSEYLNLYFYASNGTSYVRNVKVEVGDTATKWIPTSNNGQTLASLTTKITKNTIETEYITARHLTITGDSVFSGQVHIETEYGNYFRMYQGGLDFSKSIQMDFESGWGDYPPTIIQGPSTVITTYQCDILAPHNDYEHPKNRYSTSLDIIMNTSYSDPNDGMTDHLGGGEIWFNLVNTGIHGRPHKDLDEEMGEVTIDDYSSNHSEAWMLRSAIGNHVNSKKKEYQIHLGNDKDPLHIYGREIVFHVGKGGFAGLPGLSDGSGSVNDSTKLPLKGGTMTGAITFNCDGTGIKSSTLGSPYGSSTSTNILRTSGNRVLVANNYNDTEIYGDSIYVGNTAGRQSKIYLGKGKDSEGNKKQDAEVTINGQAALSGELSGTTLTIYLNN